MTHKRYANQVDKNQKKIINGLRKIPGVSVVPDHHDIIVGFRGCTYWFEIKNPETALKKDKTFTKNAIRKSQAKLLNEFNGHYEVVTSLDEILKSIGVLNEH